MSWYITKDKIDDGNDVGQWNGSEDTFAKCKANCKHAFRMLDDDGEVYYHGRSSIKDSFQPLDDFGEPNAGCTMIQYYENKRWVTI